MMLAPAGTWRPHPAPENTASASCCPSHAPVTPSSPHSSQTDPCKLQVWLCSSLPGTLTGSPLLLV
jgi:hypothetical protein